MSISSLFGPFDGPLDISVKFGVISASTPLARNSRLIALAATAWLRMDAGATTPLNICWVVAVDTTGVAIGCCCCC